MFLKPHTGSLVVFEGVDGCGKGTQIDLLMNRLIAHNKPVVISKTPGGTDFGDKIRDILFHTTTTHKIQADACSLLYLASHLQSFESVVEPALLEGKVVLSDRWDAFSGRVYAPEVGACREVADVRETLCGTIPDLTIYMKGDPAVFLERAKGRGHQAGKRWSSVEALSRVAKRYDELFVRLPEDKLFTVQADEGTAIEIFERAIWPRVLQLLSDRLANVD